MKLEKRKVRVGWRYRARISLNYTTFNSPWFASAQEAQDWAAQQRLDIKAGQVNTGSEIVCLANIPAAIPPRFCSR